MLYVFVLLLLLYDLNIKTFYASVTDMLQKMFVGQNEGCWGETKQVLWLMSLAELWQTAQDAQQNVPADFIPVYEHRSCLHP